MKTTYALKGNKINGRFRFRKIAAFATVLAMVCSMATACGETSGSTSDIAESATETTTQYMYIPSAKESQNVHIKNASSAYVNGDQKDVETSEKEIVRLCNEKLNEAARKRAKELADKFSHTRPNGTDGATVVTDVISTAKGVSENIQSSNGKDYYNGEYIFGAWEDSSKHNKKILSPDNVYMGVGVYYVYKGDVKYTYAVQLFCESL